MLIEKLSLSEYSPSAAGATDFTSVVSLTPPAVTDTQNQWRWVRIQAHDGDLLVTFGNQSAAPATPDAGCVRIFSGTVEVFQVPPRAQVKIIAASGTVNGSVQWGR